ncbi:hypothetical protein C9374_007949 [Naegleria lovaniensis]|uniref:Uncharacterized protein n=1 Tax=Naegleria lovaniensis TaxID=51637 RepID=A0AA88GLR8_NAELO|nr:uncharacterized protein C9374_007949 [Naegleria lovaniensis]KAG2378801.1 hypothetical protein C9374_007949 [Naegleria lovaniensis]
MRMILMDLVLDDDGSESLRDGIMDTLVSQNYMKLCKKMRDTSMYLRKGFDAKFELVDQLVSIHDHTSQASNHQDSSNDEENEDSTSTLCPFVVRICYTRNMILVGNALKETNAIEFFDLNSKKHLHTMVIENVPYYLCVEENDVFSSGAKSRRVLNDEPCFMYSDDSNLRKYKLNEITKHGKKCREEFSNNESNHSDSPKVKHEWNALFSNATSVTIQYSKNNDATQNIIYICTNRDINILNSVSGIVLGKIDMSASLSRNIICLEILEESGELVLFSKDRFYVLRKKVDNDINSWAITKEFGQQHSDYPNVVDLVHDRVNHQFIACDYSSPDEKLLLFKDDGEFVKIQPQVGSVTCCLDERDGILMVGCKDKILFYK